MEILKNNKKIIIILMAIIFILGILGVIFLSNKEDNSLEIGSFNLNNQENVSSEGMNEEMSKNVEKSQKENEDTIYIHIIGEVNNQGIITLKSGQRIIDAIEKAGGVTEQADLSKVNLAFILSDGQKVKIPNVNDKEENEIYVTDSSGNNVIINGGIGVSIGNVGAYDGVGGRKVNINTANQTELETLNGVGPSLAAKIIDYRNKNGKFKNIEDLKNVSGIGDTKFEGIRNQVVVK